MNKKNLLIITYDQYRGDWLSNRKMRKLIDLKTTNKIIGNSIIASRCYTSSPQCVPARISWITGKRPSQLGITRNCAARIKQESPSLIRELQKAGWFTQIIGKTHWTEHNKARDLREDMKLIQKIGFNRVTEIPGPRALARMKCDLTDEWEEEGYYDKYVMDLEKRYRGAEIKSAWEVNPSILPNRLYPDIWLTNQAIKEIKKLPMNQPWCLWISYVGPHEPFDTPTKWKNEKIKDFIPQATGYQDWIKDLGECELKSTSDKWKGKLTRDEIENIRLDYANKLTMLDEMLGKIMDSLSERQDINRTDICITSDHGEMLGDYGMLYKGTFLEPSIRVPLIYYQAGKERKNQTIDNPIDLTKSLREIIKDKINSTDNTAFKLMKNKSVTIEYGEELAIIRGSFKLVANKDGRELWASKCTKNGEQGIDIHREKLNPRLRRKLNKIRGELKRQIAIRKSKGWIIDDLKV